MSANEERIIILYVASYVNKPMQLRGNWTTLSPASRGGGGGGVLIRSNNRVESTTTS